MNTWILRVCMVMVVISVNVASPPLAQALIAIAGFGALLMLLYKGRYLPGFVMDVLDRLSNKDALEHAYSERAKRPALDSTDLARRIKAKVIGQDAVVDSIATQLRRRLAARRRGKPVAVFCFAGPPGVGKTHLAKVLTSELQGETARLHFFDMSQFAQPHAAASLFGQARGYVGSTSYGALTAALRDAPNAVILLDEFEKAHPEVHKRFLTAWNDGFVTELSDGGRISTAEAIFILTTNAASRQIGEIVNSVTDTDERDRLAKAALQDAQFAPEVLSRIDDVFCFRPLAGLDVARVVALEIERLAEQYSLTIEDGGIDSAILLRAIEEMGQHMDGGVRDVARAIEREVSDGMIDARSAGATHIRVADDNGVSRVIIARRETRPATEQA